MTETLRVDGARLYASIEALGAIGAYSDGGLVGVCRLALTSEDAAGRAHVVQTMEAAGLVVTVDGIGNVWGRREGLDPAARPVVVGSHIDSVATAGRFDGCLGVLAGIEIATTLQEAGQQTRRPLIVVFFTEEEGARFGTDMLGSAVATGRVSLEQAWGLRDPSGRSVREELARIGFLGDGPVPVSAPHAYVECHIEQGPTLRAAKMDIGVVSGVQAICWHEVEIRGRACHAGTTPMELRADPGVAAAKIQLTLREMVRSGSYGSDLRATVGALQHHPGLVNVVPDRVRCTVDLRHPEDAVLRRAEDDLRAHYLRIAAEEGVSVSHRQTARTPDVPFSPKIQDMAAAAAKGRGLRHRALVSGAGHDCQEMARLCPSGMVFVPGEYDGISHNPREYSTPAQCEDGANVLLDVVLALAAEEGP